MIRKKTYVFLLGNAKVAGIENSLNLNQTQYSWAVSIYFIGFVSIPSYKNHLFFFNRCY